MLKGPLKASVASTISIFEGMGLKCFVIENADSFEPTRLVVGDYQIRSTKNGMLLGTLPSPPKSPKLEWNEDEDEVSEKEDETSKKYARENVGRLMRLRGVNEDDLPKTKASAEAATAIVIATDRSDITHIVYKGEKILQKTALTYGVKPALDAWEHLPEPAAKPEATEPAVKPEAAEPVAAATEPARPAANAPNFEGVVVVKTKPHTVAVSKGQLALF